MFLFTKTKFSVFWGWGLGQGSMPKTKLVHGKWNNTIHNNIMLTELKEYNNLSFLLKYKVLSVAISIISQLKRKLN